MRRTSTRATAGVACTALVLALLVGCADDPPVAEPTREPSVSGSPSESPSGSPSGSPTESPSGSASESPSGSPSESDDSAPAEPRTEIPTPSSFGKTPKPLADVVSAVELGRLSVGGGDRLSGENFAIAVAQFIVDTRMERDQRMLVDDIASTRLSESARDEIEADYDGQRGLQSGRHFMRDGEAWVRSGTKGRKNAPREVQVELAGVMDTGAADQLFLGAVRVDVVRRAGRWELLRVAGPAIRGPFDSVLDRVKPRLEGPHWRQLPRLGDEPSDAATKKSSVKKKPQKKNTSDGKKRRAKSPAGRKPTGDPSGTGTPSPQKASSND